MRVVTKIGDVFSVKIDEESKKYFQLIAFDRYQLNSDVIRAFKKIYPLDSPPSPEEIIKGEVEFYAHCVTNLGVKMGVWEKVGKAKDIGDTSHILFRGTSDYGQKFEGKRINVSSKWYIWKINDRDSIRVGKLEGENRKAEIGVIVNPYDIEERMKTGKYSFFYPDFE
jgi:hypothetical protein